MTNQSTTLVIGSLTSHRISRLCILSFLFYPCCPTSIPRPLESPPYLLFLSKPNPLSPRNLPNLLHRISLTVPPKLFAVSWIHSHAAERRAPARCRGSVTNCNSRYASGTPIALERRKARETKRGEAETQGKVYSVDSVEVSPSFRLHGRNTALAEVCDLKSYFGVQPRRLYNV